MTPNQISIVGIRLLVIVWLLSVIGQVAGALVATEHGGLDAEVLWTAAGVQLLVCVFLWLFPAMVASKLLRGGMESVSAGSVPFHEWRDLCFVVVGACLSERDLLDDDRSGLGTERSAFHLRTKGECWCGIAGSCNGGRSGFRCSRPRQSCSTSAAEDSGLRSQ